MFVRACQLSAFDCRRGAVTSLSIHPLQPQPSHFAAVEHALAATEASSAAQKRAKEAAERAADLARRAESLAAADLDPDGRHADEAERAANQAATEAAAAAEAARIANEKVEEVHIHESQLLVLAGAKDGTWAKFLVNGKQLRQAASDQHQRLLAVLKRKAERKLKKRRERDDKEKEYVRQQEQEMADGQQGTTQVPAQDEREIQDDAGAGVECGRTTTGAGRQKRQ